MNRSTAPSRFLPFLCLLLLLTSGRTAEAQCPPGGFVVSGSVVDALGLPLVGFDIDILDALGNPLPLSGDYTDGNGLFTLTICQIVPDGFYDVIVRPPSTTNFLQTVYPAQFIAQGAVIGPFVVELGVRLQGTVTDEAGLPIFQADFQFADPVTGAVTQMNNETTDLTGSFDILLESGTWNVTLRDLPGDTLPAGPYVDTDLGTLVLVNDLHLGSIVLRRGYSVLGTVLDAAGLPVAGADLDVTNPTTGTALPISGDFTEANGLFSVLIPAGSWELEVEAPAGSGLAGTIVDLAVTPPGPVLLGTITLANGVLVSGVTTTGVAPVPDVDLDFVITTTGSELPTPDDNADGSGVFGVLVGADTYDIQFRPPFISGRAPVELPAVAVTAPTDLGNVVLPPGVALTGTITLGGVPLPGARITLSQGGSPVLVFGNRTDLLGNFALRQVADVYDITVTPPIGLPAAPVTIPAIDLTIPAVIDVDLIPTGPTPPPPVLGLSCTLAGNDVQLGWTLGSSDYEEILVLRNAVVVGVLGPQSTSFIDAGLPAGSYEYLVRSMRSGLFSSDSECSVMTAPTQLPFIRADATGDGAVNIADAINILGVLFDPLIPLPTCRDRLDVNDDGSSDISDAVYLLSFLFTGGPPPPPPFPSVGPDPTPDSLNCF
ncbi:MAG: hypothetical protein ACO4B4_05320 [Planctomycetota bacterium]